MIRITYSHKSFRDDIQTDSSKNNAPPFSDIKSARSWAVNKWKFLNWPENKTTKKMIGEKDGKKVTLTEWTAEKNDGVYLKQFEMTILEVG